VLDPQVRTSGAVLRSQGDAREDCRRDSSRSTDQRASASSIALACAPPFCVIVRAISEHLVCNHRQRAVKVRKARLTSIVIAVLMGLV